METRWKFKIFLKSYCYTRKHVHALMERDLAKVLSARQTIRAARKRRRVRKHKKIGFEQYIPFQIAIPSFWELKKNLNKI